MLQELSIRNFAIIDDLSIRFADGLTILSGETGAGKTILINAVNLLLGSRASAALIRTGSETAELEGLFAVDDSGAVADRMTTHGFDPADGLVVRRVISRADANRIYINGRLSTQQMLYSVTENLASISGQHAHQTLLKEEQQLFILDQFAGLMPLRRQVYDGYHRILPVIQQLDRLQRLQQQQAQQFELLSFQQQEIAAANIAAGEDEQLEKERMRLKNAAYLYQTVFDGIESLYGSEGSASEKLVEVKKTIEKAAAVDGDLKPRADRLAEIAYQFEDVVEEFRGYLSRLSVDEERLGHIEERLNTLNRLKRKYGGSLPAVEKFYQKVTTELSAVENVGKDIAAAEAELVKHRERLASLSERLSRERSKAAGRLCDHVVSELADLRMAQTRFEARLSPVAAEKKTSPYLVFNGGQITDTGTDRVAFLIAPNVGEDLKPLAAIASGGELSRVVLAIKAILAETDSVGTIVFDEVDAGIGGGVAEIVGKKLGNLACHHQVICITHLPQIAKFGNHHYHIAKKIDDGRTKVTITLLNETQRVEEIARMLGGVELTQATLDHARELVKR
jgi:DNA repair protein RecN (Recombination protein N)